MSRWLSSELYSAPLECDVTEFSEFFFSYAMGKAELAEAKAELAEAKAEFKAQLALKDRTIEKLVDKM